MKNSRGDARRWLLQAENDLAFGRLALREGFFAQACFISHQVAEKSLKALAYYRGDRTVIGHSLLELASSLEPTYPQLSKYHELAGILDQYYVPTRSPNALPGAVGVQGPALTWAMAVEAKQGGLPKHTTIETRAPIRAAATAWLAPLPPG